MVSKAQLSQPFLPGELLHRSDSLQQLCASPVLSSPGLDAAHQAQRAESLPCAAHAAFDASQNPGMKSPMF